MKTLKTVLTIAGSDSSGGAGMQADLNTIAAHFLSATSVVTSVTSQNTHGVQGTFDLPSDVIREQLRAVFSDARPGAVKTGMLGNEEIVMVVARELKKVRVPNLVIDPVIRSTSGKSLLNKKGIEALKEKLFPLATVITPNLKEAAVLSGVTIKKDADRLKAAKALKKLGAKSVLIKGGHSKGAADDFFFDGKSARVFEGKRLPLKGLHGTGCVLASAIASNLAHGYSLPDAIGLAKEFVSDAIAMGVKTGEGAGQVHPMGPLYKEYEKSKLLERASLAIQKLKSVKLGPMIPEVQSNLGFGLPGASGPEEVIAIPGRIIRDGDGIATIHSPQFGASQHVAKIVLTVMRFDPEMRAVMNLKCKTQILDICKKLKFKMASFDRGKEPKNVKQLEGSSLEWGTRQAILDFGKVPDIIFDLGGQGKEEMIRVIAPDVEKLVEKVLKIQSLAEKHGNLERKDAWRKR